MSVRVIKIPYLGVNDTECDLVDHSVESGQKVSKGDVIAVVETTKSTFDVVSEEDAYVYWTSTVSQRYEVDAIIGISSLDQISHEGVQAALDELSKEEETDEKSQKITKKAEILIQKYGITIEDLKSEYRDCSKIGEAEVASLAARRTSEKRKRGFCDIEKVAIIGGAGGGGALIIIDSLLRSQSQRPVAVFDRDSSFHNDSILGVPIVGSIDLLDQYISKGEIDSVVIAFNKNLTERKNVFDTLVAKGVSFCNVIDPTCNIRSHVILGKGNVILGNAYIGSCSEIGDNNFISSNVCLEHGNSLGNHCAFGPSVVTSGNVSIGDQVRFAAGIAVEPNLTIGDGAIISSGAVIDDHVPPDSVVQVKYSQHIKPLKQGS